VIFVGRPGAPSVVYSVQPCFDGPQRSVREDVVCTLRPHTLHLGDEGLLGNSIRFIAPSRKSSDKMSNSLYRYAVQCVHGNQIDSGRMLKWIQLCEDHHPECAPEKLPSIESKYIRFVDVGEQCIVEMPLNTRYLTLSYVWGRVPLVRLMKSNLQRFMTKGSLTTLQASLPKTIVEALALVSVLGERYMWIDSLCLVSDDADDMSQGIQMMDQIYAGSALNIIAASGDDANAGLPGVLPNSRQVRQDILRVRNIKMPVFKELGWYLSQSKYGTRGWT
jgi:hypothetical protein